VASHTSIHKKEEEKIVKEAAAKAKDEDKKATLGDANSQLQALKDKMNEDNK
jgi:small subunit ribosomal protein S1